MVNAMVLLDTNGPLPVKATFNSPVEGSVMFVLTATAWTETDNTLVMVTLALDDAEIGNSSMCFSNGSYSHMALRPTFIPYDSLTIGEHTIYVDAGNSNAIGDLNDYFQVTMFY